MILEAGKAYIQKNPLFGKKVIRFERIRPSVWDWNLCDATVVTIDEEPTLYPIKNAASSIYDHQGLEEIPVRVFDKLQAIVRLLNSMQSVTDGQKATALRLKTLDQISELLTQEGIIDNTTYSPEQLRRYSEEYDQYSRQQMERVTDIIDVHK